MKQYLDLVRTILDTGTWQENRTGIRTISMPGAMLRFDLQQGFPAVTTKKLAFKSAVGELVGFLRASRSAADFRDLGCKVWDANANQNPQWLANPYRQGPDDLFPERVVVCSIQRRRAAFFYLRGLKPELRIAQNV